MLPSRLQIVFEIARIKTSRTVSRPWYLYKMVTKNTIGANEEEKIITKGNIPTWDYRLTSLKIVSYFIDVSLLPGFDLILMAPWLLWVGYNQRSFKLQLGTTSVHSNPLLDTSVLYIHKTSWVEKTYCIGKNYLPWPQPVPISYLRFLKTNG